MQFFPAKFPVQFLAGVYRVGVIDREQSFPASVPLEAARVHVVGAQALLELTQKNKTVLGSDQFWGEGFPLLSSDLPML